MKKLYLALLLTAGAATQTTLPAASEISLQVNNGQWTCADGGGGTYVVADRNSVGWWETFILNDTNGGSLNDGDYVTIRTRANGLYVRADGGGGGNVTAKGLSAGSWETFRIYKQNGSGTIGNGDSVALQVNNGMWVCAENGGGTNVVADRSSVGAWETFTITLASAPSVLWVSPTYSPSFWNDGGTVQVNNNCYNYSNNRRTDTFAQPGRAGGDLYSSITVSEVSNGCIADGLEPTTAWASSPEGKTKIALVIWPGTDYHFYRQDSGGSWSHKPGQTAATNLDNSSNTISNPETADRGNYTTFGGYFFTPIISSSPGFGNANIN